MEEKMRSEMEALVKKLELEYPDRMVVDRMDEWERAKLAGKVELVQWIKELVKEGIGEPS